MQSPWLDLDAAEILFSTARKRVYTGKLPKSPDSISSQDTSLVLEQQPKWSVLSNILSEILQSGATSNQGGPTLIMCQDRQTCSQVAEYLQMTGDADAVEREDTNPTNTNSPSNKYMHRKFLNFLAWRNDFAKFRASNLSMEQRTVPTNTRGIKSNKAPANKRRRVRGTAQFNVTANSREPHARSGQAEAPNNASNLPQIDLTEGIYEDTVAGQDIIGSEYEMHDQNDAIVIHPYGSGLDDSLLEELQPENVIMYNPDAAFIRSIEVYRSSHTTAQNIRVYFIYYGGSVEEQTYLSKVRREKDSFTKLIKQKAVSHTVQFLLTLR
ncbi:hypothetical protein ABW21_db0207590 [Orbilia brochopaga]|nr:hypothetical protein ABW21_db0207590 [Drechslerella brochopaga]